ncbi:MAG: hydrogenase maturation nickel metallochaperone HypA [Deltaproteobacteria bacterium GWA2_55_10]|nr:MAG: hydrogenase maturation nickel metallochaperone HypA [Deltaproteobacteria bacterium GWA2_55_10]
MHEMSITRSIVETVEKEMDRAELTRLDKVRIRVGELTAVEPDVLRFCFETTIKGTRLEGAALDIEEVPLTGRCKDCGNSFRITAFESLCPKCKCTRIERTGGTELDIQSIEAY